MRITPYPPGIWKKSREAAFLSSCSTALRIETRIAFGNDSMNVCMCLRLLEHVDGYGLFLDFNKIWDNLPCLPSSSYFDIDMYHGYGGPSNYGNRQVQQNTNAGYGRNNGYYGPDSSVQPDSPQSNDLARDIVGQVTHEFLLESGNKEYSRIYAEVQDLRKQVIKLETHVEVLQALHEKDQAAMMNMRNVSTINPAPVPKSQMKLQNREVALRAAFPMAFDTSIQDPPKQRDAYGNVKFWFHKDYTKCKKQPAGNIAARLRFLEDDDGDTMEEKRLEEIRIFLQGAFMELRELDPTILPKSWANCAHRDLTAACHAELSRWFQELSLCSGDWKARTLMVEWYPCWKRNHLDSGAGDSNNTDVEIMDTVPAKRAAAPSKQPKKKTKVKEEISVPEIPDPFKYTLVYIYAAYANARHRRTTVNNNVTASGGVAPVNNVTNTIHANGLNSISLSTTVHGYQASSTALNTASVLPNNAFQLNMPSTVSSTSSTSTTGTVSTNNHFQLNTPSTASSLTSSTMSSMPHTLMSNTQLCNSTSNTSQPGPAQSIPNLQMTSTIPGSTPDAQRSASNAFELIPKTDIPRPSSAQVSSASNTSGTAPSNIRAELQVSSLPTTASGAGTSLTLSTEINKEASGSQLMGPPPQQSAKKSEAKKRGRKPMDRDAEVRFGSMVRTEDR
ncbi:hypothetical protein JOM56_014209 [Amanita muscaria]